MLNHACCEVTNVHVSSINSKTTLIRFLNPELTGNMTQLYSCKTRDGWGGALFLTRRATPDKTSRARRPGPLQGVAPGGESHTPVPLRVSRGPRKWRAHGMSVPWPSVSQNVDSDWISRTKWRRNSASPLRLTGGNNQAGPKESGVWTEEVGGSEHLSPENWSKSYILPTSRVEEAPNSIWGPYCSAVFSRSTD